MSDPRDELDFGPSGYLPERASKRARKIVLRAPLGIEWVWASIVAGLFVLLAGVLFLSQADDGPSAPFELVAPVASLGDATFDDTRGVLYVTVAGRPRAFDVAALPAPVTYCEASRQLEGRDGQAWSLTGRGLGGTPSLDEHPTVVFEGDLHVDFTTTLSGPPPSSDPVQLGCADTSVTVAD